MLDWDDLRIFHEAVRAGDYSSTARALGMDRTTVGRRIARLEQRLGEAIWSLTESGYRPTQLGHELLAIAEQMEQSLARLPASLAGKTHVRLAGSAGLADLILPKLRAMPGLTIEVATAQNAVAAVQGRSADLGIAVARDLPPGMNGMRACAFRQALYTAIGRGAADRRIAWSHATMLANPFAWARLNAPAHATSCEVGGMTALTAAVSAGFGTAWIWDVVGDADPRLSRLPDVAPTAAASELWIVHRADLAAAPAAILLRDEIAAILSNLQAASELSRIASPAAR